MIHSAIISGSIEQALFRDGNGLWLIEAPGKEPQPADHQDAAVFYNIALEVCHAAPDVLPINLEELNQKLTHEVKFIRALRGLLVGMDPEYGEDLRRKNLASANAILLANDHLIEGIQTRMFVPTNNQEWDCAGALKIANAIQAACAAEIYLPIADGTVDRVMDALSSAVIDLHGSGVRSLSVREGLQKAGLVARITALVSSKDVKGLKSLAFTLKKYPAIAELDSNARVSVKVASALIASIEQPQETERKAAAVAKRRLPMIEAKHVSESDLTNAVTTFFDNWKRRKNRGQANEFADLEAIHKEVDWIAKRLHAGELPKAEFALIQLIKRQEGRSDPDHLAKSLTNVAGHARKAKGFDFCFAILDAIDLMNARDATAADIRAEALSELGKCDEALAVFEETMARFPDNAVVRNGYGELLREMGQFDASRAVFEESMARFPGDAVVRSCYGELLREMGQFDAARAVFEESIARFPDDVFARSGYGELLREMDQFDAARAVFEESMARFPNNAVVRNGYVQTLLLDRDFTAVESVIANIEQKISHSDWISFHILAMSYLRKGEPEEALALFRSGELGCPFPQMTSYFRSGVVMALIALRRDAEARQVIADTPEQHGASKRALSILEAHALGAAGNNEGTARILAGISPETLTKHEKSLVDALKQIYVLRSVPKAELEAANDNVMDLEVIIFFNALGRVQRMRRAA